MVTEVGTTIKQLKSRLGAALMFRRKHGSHGDERHKILHDETFLEIDLAQSAYWFRRA